jgi:uncharacterized repeat protein (TIGR04138 family)
MPPLKKHQRPMELAEIVRRLGLYPYEAFEFVRQGMDYTLARVHPQAGGSASLHVSGQELCEGLRRYALSQWGMMAGAVLAKWNVSCTMDFGRIVFAMIEGQLMSRTEQDSIEDFRSVYDFRQVFGSQYEIGRGE